MRVRLDFLFNHFNGITSVFESEFPYVSLKFLQLLLDASRDFLAT